ncbi:MAG: ABC transporter permease [Spirochaetales bacterium]
MLNEAERALATRRMLRIAVSLGPLLLPFAAVFLGGIVLSTVQSFGVWSPVEPTASGLSVYRQLLSDPWFPGNAWFSASVAFRSAFIAVVGGFFLALAVWKLPQGFQGPAVIYHVPLILPHLAVALVVMVVFGSTGFLARLAALLESLSLPVEYNSPLFDTAGRGLVIAYVYKELPFAAVLLLPVLRGIDPRLLQTAEMLGARRATIMRRIIIPEVAPVAATVFIIMFLYAFGAYDIPFVLGSSRPQMLSIAAYTVYFERQLAMRPLAYAMLTLMALASLILLYLYARLARKVETVWQPGIKRR